MKSKKTPAKRPPPIPIRAVDFVMYCAAEPVKLRSWYKTLFGLEKGDEWNEFWSEFATEPVALCINGPNKKRTTEWDWSGSPAIAFAVADIHAAAAACKRRKVTILKGRWKPPSVGCFLSWIRRATGSSCISARMGARGDRNFQVIDRRGGIPKQVPDVKDEASGREPMSRSMVWLMATTVGVIVANIYYVQPLLADIARGFDLTVTRAGAIATLSQVGTALGMFLFVPLGDKLERRSLITNLMFGECAALLIFAAAPNVPCLAAASFAVGALAATVHVVVPFAASLASAEQRGRVIGTMVAGILFGVLLARAFSGLVGALFGWRSVYAIASVAVFVLAAVIRTRLPRCPPSLVISWPELMRSTAQLVRRHALLRESAILGALCFAAFSAFWTTLIFLLKSPAYHYGSAVAGFFGLVGAAGAAGAPTFGHLADKHGPRATIRVALWLSLFSFLLMGFVGKYLTGLIISVLLMDLGIQLAHVSNQTRIYSLDPTARSRLNMVYMFCYFVGGAVGSYFGAVCWHYAGWWGVCSFAAGILFLAIIVEFFYNHREQMKS